MITVTHIYTNFVKSFFLVILLGGAFHSSAQNLLVGPEDLPIQFTYCGMDTFSVDIRKPSGNITQVSTFNNVQLTVTLPLGMIYFAETAFAEDIGNGSTHGIVSEVLSSNNEEIILNLANFLPNGATSDQVTVYLPVRANCQIEQNAIDFDLTYDYNHPVNGPGSGSHAYSSDQLGLASPNIIIVDALSDYNITEAQEGDIWTRTFELQNSVIGEYCVDTIYFIDKYPSDIKILEFNAGTIVDSTSSRVVVMLTSDDFLALSGKDRICRDDRLTLTQKVESVACITSDGQLVSTITVGVSCTTNPSDLCTSTSRFATHTYPLGDPGLYFRSLRTIGGPEVWPEISFAPSCKDEGNEYTIGFAVINPSTEFKATAIRNRFYTQSSNNLVDTSSVYVKIGANSTYQKWNGPWEYISAHNYAASLDDIANCAGEGAYHGDVTFRYPELPPGDTLFVITTLKTCFADPVQCFKPYYSHYSYHYDLYYKDACESNEYYKGYYNPHTRQIMDSPPSTDYNPTILEGEKGCFSFSMNGHSWRTTEFFNKECDQSGVDPYGDPVEPGYEMIIDYNNDYLAFQNDPGDFSLNSTIGTTWTPTTLDFVSNPGKITAIFSLPPPYGFGGPSNNLPNDCQNYTVNLNGATLDFKLEGVCPVSCAGYINSEVALDINHILDQCGDEDNWIRTALRCNDTPLEVTTVCEFCNPCDGTSVTSFSMKRGNYGTKDDNNDRFEDVPNGNVTADPDLIPEIATNRYFPGDTAVGDFALKVNTSQFDNFSFTYLRFGLPSSDYKPLEVDFTIYDVSTGDSYSFEDIPGTYDNNAAGDELLFNMSPYYLQSFGPDNIPSNFVFENGDSIVGDFSIQIFENVGIARLQKILQITGFNTTTLDAGPSERYSCNIFFAPAILVGWEHNRLTYSENTDGCNTEQDIYYTDFFVGPHANGNNMTRDQFPYEYRKLNTFTEHRFEIPATYTFQYLRWYYRGDNGGGLGAVAGENWIVDPQYYYIDNTTNELVIDVDRIMFESNNQFPTRGPIDETTRYMFRPYYQATCETEVNAYNYFREQAAWVHHFEETCDAPVPDTILIDDSNRYFRQNIEPIVTATNLSPSALLYTPEACWTTRIYTGTNGPRSMFAYFESVPGAAVDITKITRLSDGSIINPEADDWYKLGDIRNDEEEFEICAYVTACEPGAIKGYVGWQCDDDSYPVDIETYKESTCNPLPLNLLYEPLEEFVQADFVDAGQTETVTLCQPIDFSVVGASVSQATAYNLGAYIVVSGANSPYELVDGEANLTYPYPTGTAITLDSTDAFFGASSTFPPFNGDAYYFDLSTQIDSLPGIGAPPGVPEDERSLRMDFSLTTNCNTTSGTEIWFYLVYEDACGNKSFTPTKFSKTMVIEGAVVDTLLDWIIAMDDTPIDACEEFATYQVQLDNLSRFTSKGQDQLVLTTNGNIDFLNASCPANSDDCMTDPSNPTITATSPGGGLQGFNEIIWEIPPGVEEGESIILDMTFAIDPALECGTTQFDFKTKAQGPKVLCEIGDPPYEACNIQINTTNGRPTINIEIVKPELSIENIIVEGTVISGVGEEFEYSVDICNTGDPVNAGDTTRINFYYDTNSDGIVDAGDVLLHTEYKTDPLSGTTCLPFSGTFPIDAGYTCGILLEIDPTTCKCNSAVASIGDFPLVGTITNDLTICHNGTATIMGEALPGYTYTWIGDTDGLSNTNILNSDVTYSNTSATALVREYILEIDRNGSTDCDGYDTLYVTVLPEIKINGTEINIACNGQSNGSIATTVSGGNPPYTYLWSTGETTSTISNLVAGNYTVSVTSNNMCMGEATFQIAQPTTLSLGIGSSAAFCGQSDGTATVLATGGTAPYTYLWNTGASSANISNLSPGYYTVSVQDSRGCEAEAFAEVLAGGGPAIQTSYTNSACGGASSGSASVLATPASGSYSYLWSTNETSTTITNLSAGTYTLTVTDLVSSCISIASVNITEGDNIILLPNVLQPDCGASNGAATVSINGGTPPYTYLWDDASSSTTTGLTNVGTGGYCVTITDALNCTASTCMTLLEACCDLDVDDTVENISCNGGTDGRITLVVNAGTPPFSYTWGHTSGLTDSIATGLSTGIYEVTIADANCSTIKYIEITESDLLTVLLGKTNSKQCDNNSCSGAVDMTMDGGTPPYDYFWSTGASGAINSANSTEDVLSGICQGTYSVTVTDANGCEAISTVVISIDPAFTVTFGVENADCNESNGTVEAFLTDGVPPFTYNWDGYPAVTSSLLDDLAAGNYTLTITDGTGCTLIKDVYVNNNINDAPYLVDKIITPTNCGASTGSIDINIAGGTPAYTFAWSTGATTEDILNIPVGDYTVTITDADGCLAQYNFTIIEDGFEVDFTYGIPPCNTIEGYIIANGVGGTAPYSYTWDDGSTDPNRTDLRSGVYTVTVVDAQGCETIANAELNSTDGPQIDDVLITDISCNGGNNGRVDLTITGGTAPYNVLWNNFQTGPTAISLAPGTYTCIITDIAGCKAYGEYTITEPEEELVFQLNPQGYIACNGDDSGSINLYHLSGTAPYTYLWSDGVTTEDRPNIIAGTHTVTVTDSNGCEAIASTTLEEEPPITFITEALIDTLCIDEIANFVTEIEGGLAPYTYLWSTGQTTQNLSGITLPGTYTLTVTDANNCTATQENFLIPSTLDANYTTVSVDCGQDNGAINLTLLGGNMPFNYSWAHDATLNTNTLSNLAVGTYEVTVTDGSNCTITQTIEVEAIPIYPPLTVTDYEICEGESIEFFTTLIADSYSWTGPNAYNSNLQNPPVVMDATVANAGTYRLSLTYQDCAYLDTLFNVIVNPTPEKAIVYNSGEACEGESVRISTSDTADQYCWVNPSGSTNPGDLTVTTVPFLDVTEAGTWSLILKNSFGCASEISEATQVIINPTPPSPTATSNAPLCDGEDLMLFATTIANATYYWKGPNGFVSSNQNPIINMADANNAGTYVLAIEVDACFSERTEIEVIINEEPIVKPTNNGGLCGTTLNLFANPSGGLAPYTFVWTTPQGTTLTEENISILTPDADDEGAYNVLIIDANGCTASASTLVTLVSGVPNEPIITCNSPVCEGEELIISTLQLEGVVVNYEWTGPNGSTSSGAYPNGPIITIGNASNSNTGTYTVVVSVDGCTSFSSAVHQASVSESPTVNPTASQTGTICASNATDIILTSNTSGGATPYTYSWIGPNGFTANTANPILTNVDATNAGTYTVFVTDVNGCQSTAEQVVLDIIDAPQTPIINPVGTVCSGETLLLSTQQYSGSNVVYNWQFNGNSIGSNSNTLIIDPVSTANSGTYAISVIIDGCTSPNSELVINIEDAISVNLANQNQYCVDGTTDLQLNPTVSNGTSPYAYTWTGPNGFTSSDAMPLIPNIDASNSGTYTVFVTDANGCQSPFTSAVVTIKDTPSLPIFESIGVLCEGDPLVLEIQDYSNTGTNIQYLWSFDGSPLTNNSNTLIIDPASANNAGTYRVYVNIDDCDSKIASLDVNINEGISVSVDNQDLACVDGTKPLKLTNTVSGGTMPYTYNWTGPNGFASSNANPGVPNATSINAGTYTLIVTDALGCVSDAASAIIQIDDVPPTPNLAPIDVLCFGEDITFSIADYSVYGTNISYNWTHNLNPIANNSNTIFINGATTANAGTYQVSVSVDGCDSPSSSIEVEVSEELAVSVDNKDLTCVNPGTDLTLSATINSAGTPPYTYQWTGPNGFASSGATPVVIDANATDAGTYSLILTDANGCMSPPSSTLINISVQPETPILNEQATLCAGNTIELEIEEYEGVTVSYNWFFDGNSIGNNSNSLVIDPATFTNSGEYTVYVTVDGCDSKRASIDINVQDEIVVEVADVALACTTGQTNVNLSATVIGATAPMTYYWTGPNGFESSDASPTIPNAVESDAGNYNVFIIDTNGCQSNIATSVVSILETIDEPIITSTGNTCEGETVALSTQIYAGVSVTYNWTKDGVLLNNNNNEIIINTVTTSDAGTYVLEVTVDGCTSTADEFELIIYDTPITNPSIIGDLDCVSGNQEATLTANPSGGLSPYVFTWLGPNGFGSNVENPVLVNTSDAAAGTYNVTITDANGCNSVNSLEVDINEGLNEPVISSSGNACEGETVTLSTQLFNGSSVTYTWTKDGVALNNNNNSFIINPVSTSDAGSYMLTIDVDGCETTADPFVLEIYDTPTSSPTVAGTLDCVSGNQEATLAANPANGTAPYAFNWTGPNGFSSNVENPVLVNTSNAASGTYNVTITDANGCNSVNSLEVDISEGLDEAVITSSDVVCANESVTLTIPAYNGSSVNYAWTGPNGAIGNNSNELTIAPINSSDEGDYSVLITVDACTTNSDAFTLEIYDSPSATPSTTSESICEGGLLQLSANAIGDAPLTYNWVGPNGFVSSLENPAINSVNESYNGQYLLTVINAFGCSITESITVDNILPPAEVPAVSVNGPNCEGDDLVLTTSASGSQFEWIGPLGANSGTLAMNGLTTTTNSTTITDGSPAYVSGPWSVRVTDSNGCVSTSAPIDVQINEVPIAIPTATEMVCEGDEAQLFASTVEDANYNWYDNANTLVSTDQNVTLTDLAIGIYTYSLQVEKEGCFSTLEAVTIEIKANPTANPTASYSLNNDCSPSNLQLEAAASGNAPFIYAWSGPNGFLSSDENPLITDVNSSYNGSYTLVVSDQLGCTTLQTLEVAGIVDELSQPLLTSSGPACEGESITLSVNAYSGVDVTYTWTTPNNVNITGLNSNEIILSPVSAIHNGNYSVQIVVDGCTLNSNIYPIEIFDSPTVAPSIASTGVCEGGTISLLANAMGANTFEWTGPNGFTSNAENPVISNVNVSNNGTYTVTAYNGSACSASTSLDVNTINITPATPTVIADSEVCIDGIIDLYILENYTGTVLTYEWTNGAGTIIGTTATISIAANDLNAISPFSVRVTIENCPSDYASPVDILIHQLPQAIATNGGSICPGDDAQLFANSIAGAVYEWRVSGTQGIISTEQNPILSGLTADQSYELTVISNGCVSNPVSTTTIILNDPPTLALTANYNLNADCSPSNLQLNPNVSAGSAPITSFEWIGPNGYNSNVQTPIITNASADNNGSYTVTITDENGCTASNSVQVISISDAIPEPVIASTGPACNGESITLSIDSYSGANVTYTWTTPNGTSTDIAGLNTNQIIISPVDDATHTGDYSVEVSIDACTINSDVYSLDVYDQPLSNPSVDNVSVCDGGTINLFANATGLGTLNYEWLGPNGFSSNLENPSISNVDNSYNGQYSLLVENNNGCSVVNSILVSTILAQAETPTIAVNTPNCEGDDLVLTTSASGVQFEWISPLGASTSTLALGGLTTSNGMTTIPSTHPAYLSGEWSLQVTDANACVASSPIIDVQINEVPIAIATSNSAVCEGETIELYASEVDNANYNWYDANGVLISTDQNVSLANLAAGTYVYTLEIERLGCISNPNAVSVTVNANPTAIPSSTYTLNTDCSPADLALTANPMGTSPFFYNWTGPNGFSSDEQSPLISNANSSNNGAYNLTIEDANGCSFSTILEVSGISDSVSEPVISSSGPACEGETITLSIDAYSGSAVSYAWTTPANTTSNILGLNTNEIIISPLDATTHPGNYSVQVVVDGCTINSDVYAVEIFTTPTINPIATMTPLCTGETLALFANDTDVATYEWNGPNGFTSDAANPIIQNIGIENNGTYTLVVATASGCSTTASIDVTNILPTPNTPSITSNASVCADGTITLSIQETYSNTAIFEWTNGAGTVIGAGTTMSLAANSIDAIPPFRVRVIVDNCSSALSEAIDVNILALPEAIATNGGDICQGGTAQLFASAIAGASYEWRISGDPSIISTEQNPTIAAIQSTQTYELTVISNTCVSNPTATTVVVVNNPPVLVPGAGYTLQADCSPSDLTLFASVSSTTTIVAYTWTGPNGFSSTVENPSIADATSAANGTYTLVVMDSNGCSTQASVEVNAITDEVAQPIINGSGPACAGDVISLEVQSYSGASVDYIWSIPNATNVTGLNTNEIVISPVDAIHEGVYTVQIIVDGCTLMSDSYTVDVFENPTANPTTNLSTLCEGETLSIFANATGAATFLWESDNGFVSSASNIIISNASIEDNGTYTLTVTSISGCTTVTSIDVENIIATPIQPTITSNSPVCIDETIQLAIQEDYAGATIDYSWTNGVGTVIGTNSTLLIDANDANAISPYRIQITVDNCLAPLSEPIEVIVNDLPEAIATNSGAVCPDEAAQLFANPIAGASYEWRELGSNAVISTEQNPIVNPISTTTYILTVSNNGCVSNLLSSTTIEVFDLATVNPGANYMASATCEPTDLTLAANVTLGSATIATYEWTGPNGFNSAVANPVIPNANANDNGTYSLIVTEENGCTVQGAILITTIVNSVNQPILVSSGPACEGESISLSVQQYTGATVDYVWTLPNGQNVSGMNSNEIVISPANAALHEGTYSVQVTVDGCVLTSDSYVLDVFETPTASPSATDSPLCEGESLSFFANAPDAIEFLWEGPNGFTSTAQNPEIINTTTSNNGTYTLTVFSQGACTSTESFLVENIQATPIQPTVTSNSPICDNQNIQLSVQENYIGNVSYVWTNGSGTVIGNASTVSIATSDANAISPYRVQLSVNACTSELSEPAEVLVNELPITIATNAGGVCGNESAQLFANAIAGASYNWTLAGSTEIISTEQSPVVNPSTTTTYELTIEIDGCTSVQSSFTTVEVFDAPTANPSINYTLNSNCAAEDLVLFANATGNGLTYDWVGPNGFVSTLENPTISNATELNNGTYTLTITSENGCTVEGNTQVVAITDAITEPTISSTGPACINDEVVLSIIPYEGSNVTYTWFAPNGTTTNITGMNTNEIVISPIDPSIHQGDYGVIVNVDGCVTTADIYTLQTFETPVAIASVEADTVCVNGNVQFYAESAQSYLWTGPYGFQSTTQNPFIEGVSTYHSGTYYLTTTNAQSCQSAPVALEIEVLATPSTPTIAASSSVCAGENINLSTSTTCANYLWIGPGGSSNTTLTNPLLSTTTASTSIPADNVAYSAGMWSLICVNENGCESEISNTIEVTINEVPQVPAPSSSAYTICPNEEIQLFAGDSYPSGTVFNWYDANPTQGNANLVSSLQNPNLSEFSEAGIYSYWLTTTINGCTSEASPVEITTTPAPLLLLEADNAECIESNTNINLYANSSQGIPPYTFAWTGPNGFSSTEQIPQLPNAVNEMTGTYNVVLTDANGCSTIASTVLDVTIIPAEPTIVSDNSICFGESFNISIPTYSGTDVHYEWTGPNGSTSGGDYPDNNVLSFENVNASQTGDYQVQVFVDGCSSTPSTVFEVTTNATPSATIGNNGVTCAGINEDLELTVNITNGQAPFAYYWTGPNGFESYANNPVMPNADASVSGTYTLILTDANGCQSVPVSTVVEVTDIPETPSLIASTQGLCEGSELFLSTQAYAGQDVSYIWTMADGTTDTTATPGLLISAADSDVHNGLLSVSVVVDGCSSSEATPMAINVFDAPASPSISNSTAALIPACEGENVQLQTPLIQGATYTWYGPNGFTSTLPNPSIENVSPIDTGTYSLVIEQNGCSSETVSTNVYVLPTMDSPIAGNDGPGCEENDMQLMVLNPDPELLYNWYRSIDNLYVGSGAILVIQSINITQNGGYYVISNHSSGCQSEASNTTNLVVDQVTADAAYAGTDMLICEDVIHLSANNLTEGNGVWTQLTEDENSIILNPEEENTMITDLSVGDNVFVWNVMSGACGITSTDTVVVTVSTEVEAIDDFYELELNESIESTVISNDAYIEGEHTIGVNNMPEHGDIILQSNGDFLYVPHENYIGPDQVLYEICMDACPDVCTQAMLSFQIGTEAPCTIPTIMTPNGDGLNDAFTINCLTQYPNSKISIFNRWGDEVYYNDNYFNNWEGTHKGEDLPVGTYYYILELNDGNNTNYSGYIFIQR